MYVYVLHFYMLQWWLCEEVFFFKKKKKSSWLSQALVVDAGVTEKFIISRYVLSCGMEPLQQK